MEFRILFTSGMFPDNQFSKDINKIWSEMDCINYEKTRTYFNDLTKKIHVDEAIFDWKLLFRITIGGAIEEKNIVIHKRGLTYPSDKEKVVFIRIPLPTNVEIEWGIMDKRRFNNYVKRTTDSGLTLISVEYHQFENMATYIEHSIEISLKKALYDGITLKRHKIKLQSLYFNPLTKNTP